MGEMRRAEGMECEGRWLVRMRTEKVTGVWLGDPACVCKE